MWLRWCHKTRENSSHLMELFSLTPQKGEVPMSNRKRLKKQTSRRLFRKTAGKTHKKNLQTRPMRGGIRA